MSSTHNDVPTAIDDIFSYFCSLAVQKCAKKSEKKKASCGGAAMRKRLLIKNFVAQMLDRERQMTSTGREQLSREINIPSAKSTDVPQTDEVDDEEVELDEAEDTEDAEVDSGDESDNEDSDEEIEEQEDPNNNLYANIAPSALPDISTLDLQNRFNAPQPPPFAHLSLMDTTEDIEKLDDQLFKSACYSPTTGTAIPPVSTLTQSAPSWREPEPDLYMMERSQPRYYDDYQSSTLGYRMFGDEYAVGGSDGLMSGFEQYGAFNSQPFGTPLPPTTTNELECTVDMSASILPENFMDDTEHELANESEIKSTVTAELSDLDDKKDTKAYQNDQMEEKAIVPTVLARDETTAAFVDLINMTPNMLPSMKSCRIEAALSPHTFHDMDLNTTIVVQKEHSEYATAGGLLLDQSDFLYQRFCATSESRSPRKRPLTNELTLNSLFNASPKRIKL
ncbi:hypothetical protein M3Y94_01284300 [Aphelenchoides besseyi]|nr:hypothetical protein M3Y94_01284300 [Aphelenchoides besseyi]KAI6222770.1 hypothetical protein M3Y95_00929000 [Aphelenchoides besseyi]